MYLVDCAAAISVLVLGVTAAHAADLPCKQATGAAAPANVGVHGGIGGGQYDAQVRR